MYDSPFIENVRNRTNIDVNDFVRRFPVFRKIRERGRSVSGNTRRIQRRETETVVVRRTRRTEFSTRPVRPRAVSYFSPVAVTVAGRTDGHEVNVENRNGPLARVTISRRDHQRRFALFPPGRVPSWRGRHFLTWICFWAGGQWKFPTPKSVTRYR